MPLIKGCLISPSRSEYDMKITPKATLSLLPPNVHGISNLECPGGWGGSPRLQEAPDHGGFTALARWSEVTWA